MSPQDSKATVKRSNTGDAAKGAGVGAGAGAGAGVGAGTSVNAGAGGNAGAGAVAGASVAGSGGTGAGTGGAKKGRVPSSGAKYGRDNKERDTKDKSVKRDSSFPSPASQTDKSASADRKTRPPYIRQPVKNNAADSVKNQKPGKAQAQTKPEKQPIRNATKNSQRDGETRGSGTTARDAAQPGERTVLQKDRQPQESGASAGVSAGAARTRDRQTNREQKPRGQAPGDNLKSGTADAPSGARAHNPQNIAGGARGRYAQSAQQAAKIKVGETLEDIKAEIVRLEKEIDLEIKEIQSLKLAL